MRIFPRSYDARSKITTLVAWIIIVAYFLWCWIDYVRTGRGWGFAIWGTLMLGGMVALADAFKERKRNE